MRTLFSAVISTSFYYIYDQFAERKSTTSTNTINKCRLIRQNFAKAFVKFSGFCYPIEILLEGMQKGDKRSYVSRVGHVAKQR